MNEYIKQYKGTYKKNNNKYTRTRVAGDVVCFALLAVVWYLSALILL